MTVIFSLLLYDHNRCGEPQGTARLGQLCGAEAQRVGRLLDALAQQQTHLENDAGKVLNDKGKR